MEIRSSSNFKKLMTKNTRLNVILLYSLLFAAVGENAEANQIPDASNMEDSAVDKLFYDVNRGLQNEYMKTQEILTNLLSELSPKVCWSTFVLATVWFIFVLVRVIRGY